MSDTNLEVFIQNLKDTTTVLQQLEVCIKSLKNGLSVIDGYNDRLTALENKSLYQHTIYVDGLVQSNNGTVKFIFVILNENNENITADNIASIIGTNKYIASGFYTNLISETSGSVNKVYVDTEDDTVLKLDIVRTPFVATAGATVTMTSILEVTDTVTKIYN